MRDETIGICSRLLMNDVDRYMLTYQILLLSHVEGLANISQMQKAANRPALS